MTPLRRLGNWWIGVTCAWFHHDPTVRYTLEQGAAVEMFVACPLCDTRSAGIELRPTLTFPSFAAAEADAAQLVVQHLVADVVADTRPRRRAVILPFERRVGHGRA